MSGIIEELEERVETLERVVSYFIELHGISFDYIQDSLKHGMEVEPNTNWKTLVALKDLKGKHSDS